MQDADLSKEFPFKPSDFGIDEQAPTQGNDPILRFTWRNATTKSNNNTNSAGYT